jgi:hypothetical protein
VNTDVRPLTFGETLDRTWRILRQRVMLFAAIGMVPVGALLLCICAMFAVLYALGDFPQPQTSQVPAKAVVGMFVAMAIAMVPMMAVFAVFHAAACHAALAVSRGFEATWAGAYRAALRSAGRYIWLLLLCWLVSSAPELVIFALCGLLAMVLTGHGSPGAWFFLIPLIFLGYAGSVVYMVWMLLRVALAFPVAAAENLSAIQAMRRSFHLTRNAKGRIFLVMLVVYAITYAGIIAAEIVIMAIAGVLGLVGLAIHLHPGQAVSIAGITVGGLAGMAVFLVVMALIYSAYAISVSVLYEDQVIRADGTAALTGGAV